MALNEILKKRSLGILIHPSSLPGGICCGTFGKGAKDWIKTLSKHKIPYWQFLPLTPTDSTGSPYSSPSSFALNPWFLDFNELIDNHFIFDSNLKELKTIHNNKNYFDFDHADKLAKKLGEYLVEAWQFQSETRKNDFHSWTEKNSWVEDYSLFITIREEFDFLPWWDWPKEFKQKKISLLNSWREKKRKEILKTKLIQWHLDKQWKGIKNFAQSKGVNLIGDLPFYVSRDSVDVWSNKSLFSISQNGDLIFQSGVPPDYFSSTGQLWGTPTYIWSQHRRTNFRWWKKRFKRQFELADILRLDHFRAMSGYWRVDGNAETAVKGCWINSPGNSMLKALQKDLKSNFLPIIAEDLGVITEDVELLRKKHKLPGMKILQFAFDGDEKNPYLPKNIIGDNWVVYTGTHDNATSTSWWNNLEDHMKDHLKNNFDFSNNPSWDLIKIGMQTEANLFITPIQDLLSLDDDSRLNTPGTINDNWKWKMSQSLEEVDINLQKYRDLGFSYGRTI